MTTKTRTAAQLPKAGQSVADKPAPSGAAVSTYDVPGFTGASFSQQVPDLLSELRLGRLNATNWGADGTRFPE